MKVVIVIMYLLVFLLNINYAYSNQTYDFVLIDNRIIIKIKENNETLNFIFDTGSNLSLIDSAKALQLNLPFLLESGISTPGGIIKTYSTKFDLLREYNLNWAATSLSHLSKSLKYPIDGLLGVDKILHKEIIDIDFENQKIQFGNANHELLNEFQPICLKNARKSGNSAFELFFDIIPALDGDISFGTDSIEKIDLIIDTGCQYDLALVSSDSLISHVQNNTLNDYYSLSGEKKLICFKRICLCSALINHCANVPFFYNPNILNLYNCRSIALIGIPILKRNKRIIIDFPNMKMYIKKV